MNYFQNQIQMDQGQQTSPSLVDSLKNALMYQVSQTKNQLQGMVPNSTDDLKTKLAKTALLSSVLVPGEGGMIEPTNPDDILQNVMTGKNIEKLADSTLVSSPNAIDEHNFPAINQINNIGRNMQITGEKPDIRGLQGRSDQLTAEMRQRMLNPPTRMDLNTGVGPPDVSAAIQSADQIKPILNVVDMLIQRLGQGK